MHFLIIPHVQHRHIIIIVLVYHDVRCDYYTAEQLHQQTRYERRSWGRDVTGSEAQTHVRYAYSVALYGESKGKIYIAQSIIDTELRTLDNHSYVLQKRPRTIRHTCRVTVRVLYKPVRTSTKIICTCTALNGTYCTAPIFETHDCAACLGKAREAFP